MIRHLRLAFALLLAVIISVPDAWAQTAMTRSQLQTDANAYIGANGVGAVNGPILNLRLRNMDASMVTLLDPYNVFNTPPTFAGQNGLCSANGSSPITCSGVIPNYALNILNYGADPTGALPSDTALAALQAAMVAQNKPGYIPVGSYTLANQTLFDVSAIRNSGLRLYGDGCNATKLKYTGALAPAFRIGTDTANAITTLSGPVGGTFYTNGTYTGVPLTGGTGTGAIATITVSGGAVVSVAITTAGTGYLVGDVLSAGTANIGGTGSGFSITVRGDSFYSMLKGIGFVGSVPGPLMQYGRNDMLDALNGIETDVCENNSSTNSLAEGVRINSVITSPFFANTTGGPGATYGHSACEVRGAAMVNLFGSCSGYAIGQHFTATVNQAVFGNISHAIDMEVDGTVLVIDNSGGGSAPQKNTWIGGQWSWSTCGVNATSGNFNVLISPNMGSPTDFCASTGIETLGGGQYYPNTYATFVDLGVTGANGVITLPLATTSSGLAANTNGLTFTFENSADGTGNISNFANNKPINYSTLGTGAHNFDVGGVNIVSIGPAGVNFAVGGNAVAAVTSSGLQVQNGSNYFQFSTASDGTANISNYTNNKPIDYTTLGTGHHTWYIGSNVMEDMSATGFTYYIGGVVADALSATGENISVGGNVVEAISATGVSVSVGGTQVATIGSAGINPLNGIIGNPNATNATAGNVGEYISINVAPGAPVTLSTGAAGDITSVTLSPGDWDCAGDVSYSPTGGAVTSAQNAWITYTANSDPGAPNSGGYASVNGTSAANTSLGTLNIGAYRIAINSTTIVYLETKATFTFNDAAYGFLGCRRMR